jgi:nucleotide-binding universal stress UspA family protein
MLRYVLPLALVAIALPALAGDSVTGKYLETRTCQVYTGPCFANAETAMAGREAVMAWSIEDGSRAGVDLAGLSVVMVVRGDDTLAYKGLNDPKELKAAIIVDEKANDAQREALIAFAKEHTGRAGKEVVRVDAAPISMSLDTGELKGNLQAGEMVKLSTRRAKKGDCICMNEIAYYPPLVQIERFAPGVSIEAEYKGKGLGTRWSTPGSRSAYMGEFQYE